MARVDDAEDYFELTPLTQDMHCTGCKIRPPACLSYQQSLQGRRSAGGPTSHHPDHVIDISIAVVVVTINIITVIIRNPERMIEMEKGGLKESDGDVFSPADDFGDQFYQGPVLVESTR